MSFFRNIKYNIFHLFLHYFNNLFAENDSIWWNTTFAYKSFIVLFLIAKKLHYIKFDILTKSSWNNIMGGAYIHICIII